MKNSLKISVIIPVYNELSYLQQSIESVVDQSLKSLELIIVSDGAARNTTMFVNKILQRYPSTNSMFIVLDKNSGPGAARNKGVMAARGQYVVFLDADDYLLPNALEDLYDYAVNKNLDILEGTYTLVPQGTVAPLKYITKDQVFSGEQYIKFQKYCIEMSCWSKIWRRKYLLDNSFSFPEEMKQFEDVLSVPNWIYNARRIANTRKSFYAHREHSLSLSQEQFSLARYTLVEQSIKKLQQEDGSSPSYRSLLEFQIAFLLISEFILRGIFNNTVFPELRKRCNTAVMPYKYIIRKHIWDKCLYLQGVKKKPIVWLGTWTGFSFWTPPLFLVMPVLKKYHNFCLRVQKKGVVLLWKKFLSR